MSLPNSRRIGLRILAISILMWTGWTVWARTRTWCPVNVPLSLSEGSVTATSEFAVNLTGRYDIEVEATGNSTIPLKQVVCSLGLGPSLWPDEKCATQSVLRTSWIVASHDKTVAEGLSDLTHGGWTAEGSSQAGRMIGSFDAQRGQTLRLRVTTLADATSLSPTNPRLKVSMGGTAFESSLVFTGVLNIACIVLGIVGIVLVLVSFGSRAKSPSVTSPA